MGYSHYWQRAPNVTLEAFIAAAGDCQRAIMQAGVPLAGPAGLGPPVFSADEIAFNGVGAQGLEPFSISRKSPKHRHELYYCKTNRLPYDLCVQIALLICAHHFGTGFHVSSDGGEEDWAAARQFCRRHLAFGQDLVLARPGQVRPQKDK